MVTYGHWQLVSLLFHTLEGFPYFTITRVEKESACMTPPGSPQVGEPPHRSIDVILLDAVEITCLHANPSTRHHQRIHQLDAAGIP